VNEIGRLLPGPIRVAKQLAESFEAQLTDRVRKFRLKLRGPISSRRLPVHLETTAKLLILLRPNSALFSKRALKSLNNQADLDSAILKFAQAET
jgi:hypothetical protein